MQAGQTPGAANAAQAAPTQAAPAQPAHNMRTTADIQEMLDANEQYIKAIVEAQAASRMEDAARYLQKLQQNLMLLAAAADTQNAMRLLQQQQAQQQQQARLQQQQQAQTQ